MNNEENHVVDTLEKGYNNEPISAKQVTSFFKARKSPLAPQAKKNLDKPFIVFSLRDNGQKEVYKTLIELMLDEKYFIEAEQLFQEGAKLPEPIKSIQDFEATTEQEYLKHLARCGHDLFIVAHQMNTESEQQQLLSVICEQYADTLEPSVKEWISSINSEHRSSFKK